MLLLFTALQKTQFCEQQRASRCTDTEHSAPYRAGRLGIFMRRRIKIPGGIRREWQRFALYSIRTWMREETELYDKPI